MTKETCDECYYYIQDVPAEDMAPGLDGWCYRYPPVWIGERDDSLYQEWESPSVSENHWCGEFLDIQDR